MIDNEIYHINEHIKKELNNEFKGSERKKTVILDDGKKYLLKLSDPIREKGRNLSYINNAYSEYLGCKIAKSIGLPVQNVILGNYTYINKDGKTNTRPACLCEDLRGKGEKLLEVDTISLSNYEDTSKEISFNIINNKIAHIKDIDIEKTKEFYYNQFIFDALVGNTDRHNGNWGVLTDEYSTYTKVAPIYDCGSSLLPLVGDNELSLKNKDNMYLNIYSVITDNGKKINYKDFLINVRNKDVDNALLRIIPKIDLEEINNIIINIPNFSNKRKLMYSELLNKRYNNILVPALQNIFEINKSDFDDKDYDLYLFYRDNIKQISDLDFYKKTAVNICDKEYEIIRINKKYAIFVNKDICTGLLPIRSNNEEIAKAINVLCKKDDNFIQKIHEYKEEGKVKE